MKKRNSHILMVATVLMSILFMVSIAAAQRGPRRDGMGLRLGKWWNNPRVVKALEITKEQQKALNDLALDNEKEIIKLNAEKRLKRLDLITEMEKTRPDLKKVKDLVSAINDTQGKIRLQVVTAMVEGKNLLTEAQVEKLNDVMSRIRDRRHKMVRQRMQRFDRRPWQAPDEEK